MCLGSPPALSPKPTVTTSPTVSTTNSNRRHPGTIDRLWAYQREAALDVVGTTATDDTRSRCSLGHCWLISSVSAPSRSRPRPKPRIVIKVVPCLAISRSVGKVLRPSPVVSCKQLDRDQVTGAGDGHRQSRQNLNVFSRRHDLRFDPRACEEHVDDHFLAGANRGSHQPNSRQLALASCSMDASIRYLLSSECTRSSAVLSSGTATATSISRVNRGSARADTANPPTSAHC